MTRRLTFSPPLSLPPSNAVVAQDIAEEIVWVALRPKHVQIAELFVFPSCQASPTVVHRSN